MAATGSILPASVDLRAVIGADFSVTIQLFQDIAQTTPFDLTGYTVSLTVGGVPAPLTSGAGLTITAATGVIVAVLTAAQTTLMPGPAQHYSLKLTDAGGLISFPLSGNLFLALP
jgi:hypothetical protein